MVKLSTDPATRFRTALALADAGIEMMRAQIMRKEPSLTPKQVQARLNKWLRQRPGAESGDGPGIMRQK